MRICLNLDPSRLLRWHRWLAQELTNLPNSQIFRSFSSHHAPLPPGTRLLLELEQLIYGYRGCGAMDWMEAVLLFLPSYQGEQVDVVINMGGEERWPRARRVLTPLFNGAPGEIGIMAAIANDQDLLVELHDTARPTLPWTAHPASEDREVFSASLDAALSCATALILKALRHQEDFSTADHASHPMTTPYSFGSMSALGFASSTFAAKTARLLNKATRGGKAWAIGWRLDQSESLLDRYEAPFQVLSGGSSGYLADPFPFRHGGQDFIFVEQYLYSKNRGCIAVVALDRNGDASAPRIVLEEPHHLSYPFVFAYADQIWMIPESGAARNVALYRAIEFPYRWTREAYLIEDIEGYDVTPLPHREGFWFFVSPRLWKSSSWDILDLYHADSLTAHWTRHTSDPAQIDARFSRSAGAVIERKGGYLRPAQDCSRGYGGAVTFCRIDTINASEFAQTPVGRIESGPFGCHTYNRQAGLEVIDVFGQVGGLRETTVSYVPQVLEARNTATIEKPARPAGLGIRLAARS